MSFTQSSTKALVTQNVVAVKPPDLDSSLFRIRKAAVDIKALLLKFPENRKIDEKALQKLLKEATPHLIDVNAYLLDYPQIEYRLLSETVIVTPQQQKAVIARYKVVGKKK